MVGLMLGLSGHGHDAKRCGESDVTTGVRRPWLVGLLRQLPSNGPILSGSPDGMEPLA